jgi:hypothetical protein
MIAIGCRRFVCELLLCVYVLAQSAASSATGQARKSVTLTNQRPIGHFDVPAQILATKPPILFVSITKVVNPQRMSCEVLVYLARVRGDVASEDRILVGNFSLYPQDRPAGFQLDASRAFSQLETTARGADPDKIKLAVELRRIRETEPWTTVELTVAEPEWRSKRE